MNISKTLLPKKRGGARPNAGRPPKEPTKPIRVPLSLIKEVQVFLATRKHVYRLPLFGHTVPAGFPSPADDYVERELDMNEYLVKDASSTFYVRAIGESMTGVGIFPQDILVVEKGRPVTSGAIVIAFINGNFTVKRYVKKGKKVFLMPENPDFKPLEIQEGEELQIWGVVTNVVHNLEKP